MTSKKGNRLTRSPIKTSSPAKSQKSEEDDEEIVPLTLLTEFLQCVMSKDWRNALKLCNYILMYDKEHEMANNYSPMLRRAVMELEEGTTTRKSDGEEESEDSDSESGSDSETSSENSSDSDESIGETTGSKIFGISLDIARQKTAESQSSPKRSGWVP